MGISSVPCYNHINICADLLFLVDIEFHKLMFSHKKSNFWDCIKLKISILLCTNVSRQ